MGDLGLWIDESQEDFLNEGLLLNANEPAIGDSAGTERISWNCNRLRRMQRLIEVQGVGDATLAVAIAQHVRREASDHHLGGGQRRIGIGGVLTRTTEVTLPSTFINERAAHDPLQVKIKLAIGLCDLR